MRLSLAEHSKLVKNGDGPLSITTSFKTLWLCFSIFPFFRIILQANLIRIVMYTFPEITLSMLSLYFLMSKNVVKICQIIITPKDVKKPTVPILKANSGGTASSNNCTVYNIVPSPPRHIIKSINLCKLFFSST